MSYYLNVRGLAGLHIGKHVTVKTKHTEASGVLQGFEHTTATIHDSGFGGESWALGNTQTAITLLPDQRILAEMTDEVVVHSDAEPEPRICDNRNAGPLPRLTSEIQGYQADMNGATDGQVD